jgi:hypothetical protein
MAKTTTKVSSKGTCIYCKGEFEKSKMTQHLKFCKQRATKIKEMNASDEPKVKLFHILVEGTYLPMYWMHLELPADHTFYDLDGFLRETWVECCDHLSEFKVGNTSYMSQTEDMIWDFASPGDVVDADEEDDEEDEEDEEIIENGRNLSPDEIVEHVLDNMASEFGASLNGLPIDEIEAKITSFLAKEFGTEDGTLPPETRPVINMLATMVQLGGLSFVRDMPKEADMNVELGEVLKVGQKFSYTYDFGSSTNLTLRVIAEREGVEREDEDSDTIQVMARNEQPVIPCRACGKPAIGIFMGYGSPYYGAVCETCAKTDRGEYDDEMLPIVNSPRVGVCGYTGEAEMEEWDEDEEFEDEEEEE